MALYDEATNQIQIPLFMGDYLNPFNSPTLSQSEFSKHYHYLCKICKTVPIIKFSSKGKIKFICNCYDSPRELNIKNIYNLLYYSEEIDNENILLQCYHDCHFEKYIFYCQYCRKNLCIKCSNKYIFHLIHKH